MLEHAIALAQQGFHIFPLAPGTKKPMFKDWQKLATTDPETIERWWRHLPEANIAIACGRSNLLVVDLDQAKKPGGPQHGQQTLTALAADRELPRTFTVASARGGRHLYFRQPEGAELRNTAGSATAGLGPLIDTRGHGGFIVAPGSFFEGGSYLVEDQAPVAPLPSWIVDELTKRKVVAQPAPGPAVPRTPITERRRSAYADTALNRSADAVAAAPEGTRRDTLNRESFRMGRLVGGGVLQPNVVEGALRRAAHHAGLPPGETANTIASGMSAGISHPRSIPDRAPGPPLRQQPEDDAAPARTPEQAPAADEPTLLPETVTEPRHAAERDDEVEDVWSDLRSSFDHVHQVLLDWAGDDVANGLSPATDEAAALIAQTVVGRSPGDNAAAPVDLGSFAAVDPAPYDEAPAFVKQVDAAVADSRTAGIPTDGPEWTGISAIRDAVRNLWNTIKAVAGSYWAELSADARVAGPLKSLATHAARGIANLAGRAAERLEQHGSQRQRQVDSLAGLREAYINVRGQIRAHAATYEWQRISALWGTVNTLARQTNDAGIRAVVARSADAISDHAEALSRGVAQDAQADAASALTALARVAERHGAALRTAGVDLLPGAGPSSALRPSLPGAKTDGRSAQQGAEAQVLQAKAREAVRLAQSRVGNTPGADVAPRSPHGANSSRSRQDNRQGYLERLQHLAGTRPDDRGPVLRSPRGQ